MRHQGSEQSNPLNPISRHLNESIQFSGVRRPGQFDQVDLACSIDGDILLAGTGRSAGIIYPYLAVFPWWEHGDHDQMIDDQMIDDQVIDDQAGHLSNQKSRRTKLIIVDLPVRSRSSRSPYDWTCQI